MVDKRVAGILMSFGIAAVLGCGMGELNSASDVPDIKGYVTEVEEGRILVVSTEA